MHNHDIFGHNEMGARTILSFLPTNRRNVDLANRKTYHGFYTLYIDFNQVLKLILSIKSQTAIKSQKLQSLQHSEFGFIV